MHVAGRRLVREAALRRGVVAPGARTFFTKEAFAELSEKLQGGFGRVKEKVTRENVVAAYATVRTELSEAYAEMTGAKKRAVLKQSLRTPGDAASEAQADADDAADEQHRALMVVEQNEPWEKLRERLREAPIIKEILKNAKRLKDTRVGRGAAAVNASISDKVEDAREFWETSQNPLVYQASSFVDAVTAETEMATATRELRRLDPSFSLEEFRDSVTDEFAPPFVEAFIRGEARKLRPWLSDGLFQRLAHEIRLRKEEGLDYTDAKVLDCERCEILACQVEDQRSPIIVAQFMTQQINCVRNREGDIVEGGLTDIRAYFYVMAFQRDYDEKEAALTWRVIDFQLGGGEHYY
ncbi:hypothetical protein M885DRAFT_541622 [Pelagophyceae sp. CCMP2097]|nr:hypothetical protein M885DRAFT_541622 [Pelagophyceae sp. CCMP2097]|mmetsp:Transcript_860/g.3059  ORF Transcript_860/g.3059 Transcript_860/m.3059 type:complete len:353 (-) Transcript_860:103-1161(-)